MAVLTYSRKSNSRRIGTDRRSSKFRCSYLVSPLRQVASVVTVLVEVACEAGQNLARDAANHVLAPALHSDEPRVAKLLEVEAHRRRNLHRSRNAATHLAHRRSILRLHPGSLINRYRAAAVAKEFEHAKTGGIPQRLKHSHLVFVVHMDILLYSSRIIEI